MSNRDKSFKHYKNEFPILTLESIIIVSELSKEKSANPTTLTMDQAEYVRVWVKVQVEKKKK